MIEKFDDFFTALEAGWPLSNRSWILLELLLYCAFTACIIAAILRNNGSRRYFYLGISVTTNIVLMIQGLDILTASMSTIGLGVRLTLLVVLGLVVSHFRPWTVPPMPADKSCEPKRAFHWGSMITLSTVLGIGNLGVFATAKRSIVPPIVVWFVFCVLAVGGLVDLLLARRRKSREKVSYSH